MDDEQYLREAADRVMLQDLLGRYAFAADYGHGGAEAWASLFTDAGRFEIPAIGLAIEGRDALAAFAAGLRATIPGVHHVMTNFVFDIDGDTATGKCELNEFLLRPEEIYNNLQGWYEDDYLRIDNRWFINRRRVQISADSIAVTSNGRIGEYFQEFIDFCRQYRQP